MDNDSTFDQKSGDNRSDIMSAFLMRVSEFFCPSDRELALRGQIKTGWSTVAVRKRSRVNQQSKLPPQEVKHICEVVAQAEAVQLTEELRIGVQKLKLERLQQSCRGNGTSSCILCGYDFTHHRSRSPIGMHFCHECSRVMCSRCKSEYKCRNGETVVLCRLCNDARELWKKSGAWLCNRMPVINIAEDELEKAQQQLQMQQRVNPLRADILMSSPSRLEDDDDELEDGLSTMSGSTTGYGFGSYLPGSSNPPSRSPSPEPTFLREANAAAAAWKSDYSSELRPELPSHLGMLNQPSPMRKSASYDTVVARKSRTFGPERPAERQDRDRSNTMIRRSAMSGERRREMEGLRRKLASGKSDQRRSWSRENYRSASPTPLLVDPVQMRRSRSNELAMTQNRFASLMTGTHPHIKVMPSTPLSTPERQWGEIQPVEKLVRKAPEAEIQGTPPGTSTAPLDISVTQQPTPSDSPMVDKQAYPDPAPRKKIISSDGQESTQEVKDSKRIFRIQEKKKVSQQKSSTLDEKPLKEKPIHRKRASSLENAKAKEYKVSIEKKKASKTSETSPQDSKTLGKNTTMEPGPKSASASALLSGPLEVSKKPLHSEMPSNVEEDTTIHTPHLQEIGKTSSITSDEGTREQADTEDSPRAVDHTWQRRKRVARRAGRRQAMYIAQREELDDSDDVTPRSRTRSGAMSEYKRHSGQQDSEEKEGAFSYSRGHQEAEDEEEVASRARSRSGAVSEASSRTHTLTTQDADDQPAPRTRTRSGAISGNRGSHLKRSQNVKGSARPRYQAQHSPGDDGVSYHRVGGDEESGATEPSSRMHRREGLAGTDLFTNAEGEAEAN